MLAAIAALPFSLALGFVVLLAFDTAERDRAKIVSALMGRSWIAEPALEFPVVTVRISARIPAANPRRLRPFPDLRAAA